MNAVTQDWIEKYIQELEQTLSGYRVECLRLEGAIFAAKKLHGDCAGLETRATVPDGSVKPASDGP